MNSWFLYVLETAKGQLYTGITTDVPRRLSAHESGKGAKFLRGKGPSTLVCQYPAGDRSTASRLEAKVKSLTKTEKLALIQQPDLLGDMLSSLERTSAANS